MTGAATRVGDLLEEFAERGIFRGFSRRDGRGANGAFRLRWHRDHLFEWEWNEARQTLRIACVLPAVPADSPMYRDSHSLTLSSLYHTSHHILVS